MIIILILWFCVGGFFGYFRAKATYRRLRKQNPKATSLKCASLASLDFLKWTLLGVLSAVSFLAWVLLTIALTFEDEIKKMGTFEALLLSIVVFILGAIALDNQAKEAHERRSFD